MNDYHLTVNLTNSRDTELLLILEPWGDQYFMMPHTTIVVEAYAPTQGLLEVEYDDENHIIVYGWVGSVIQLFHENIELRAGEFPRDPVPRIPQGRHLE